MLQMQRLFKAAIHPGLDDPLGNLRRRPRRRDAHALLRQAQVAEDALDTQLNAMIEEIEEESKAICWV